MKTSVINGLVCALAQMNVQPGNPRANADWIIAEVDKAEAAGVDILTVPEMSVTGYLIGDMFEYDAFVRDIWLQNDRVVASTKGKQLTLIFGTIVTDDPTKTGEDGRLRKINGGIVAQNGAALKSRSGLPFFAKASVPKYRMFDEIRHMTTAHELAAERGIPIEEFLQPFDLMIKDCLVRLGLITCEDGWTKDYRVKPPLILALQGIDLLINLSASPWGWQKNRARHEAFSSYIADIGVPMLYVNISGTQNNGKSMYSFDGASTLYNHRGKVAAVVKPHFSGVESVVLSDDMPAMVLSDEDDREQLFTGIHAGFQGMLATIPAHLRKFSTALSGGVDSAVVAALEVYECGAENVLATNMPFGDHNSKKTMDSAQFTADALGIKYQKHRIDQHVKPKMELYGMTEESPGLETIIALERKNLELGIARSMNGIALCTGNKTEIGFGFYCNDGDGRGAFAPLGDLLKGEVRQLAYYLNTVVFEKEVIPFALIDGGIPAAAELKSAEGGISPDPYDYGYVTREGEYFRGYHDQMLHAFVGFRRSPEWFMECYMTGDLEGNLLLPSGKVKSLFDTPSAFVEDLERCWAAMHNSVWKRVQAPTNIAVSKRPFGFDNRESILPAYYTDRYLELKHDLLSQERRSRHFGGAVNRN
jgi:NAD+ synthase (glutamine-hydrolysing)